MFEDAGEAGALGVYPCKDAVACWLVFHGIADAHHVRRERSLDIGYGRGEFFRVRDAFRNNGHDFIVSRLGRDRHGCRTCIGQDSPLEWQIMPLIDRVQQDMVAAMKSRSEARLSALRMIKAALMKLKADSPKPLDEAAEMQVLKSLVKQRIDAAEAFRGAGRIEQAEKEEAERVLIESYLPAAASEAEVDAAIAEAMAETGATALKQMGVVMKAVQAKLKGTTVDGKALSEKVRSRLQ